MQSTQYSTRITMAVPDPRPIGAPGGRVEAGNSMWYIQDLFVFCTHCNPVQITDELDSENASFKTLREDDKERNGRTGESGRTGTFYNMTRFHRFSS